MDTNTRKQPISTPRSHERGSLSLEHVLFIGAIAGMSTGIIAFYNDVEQYISQTGDSFASAPVNIGASD